MLPREKRAIFSGDWPSPAPADPPGGLGVEMVCRRASSAPATTSSWHSSDELRTWRQPGVRSEGDQRGSEDLQRPTSASLRRGSHQWRTQGGLPNNIGEG
eukprot:671499-Prorocentrum_minimum.AAC.1